MNQLIMGAMLLTWCAGTLSGCATTEKKTSLQLKPVATSAVSNGVIYLTVSCNKWSESGDMKASHHMQKSNALKTTPDNKMVTPQKITLVNVNNNIGKTVGTSVMPVYSGDLIISGLRKGLTAAGYTVISVRKLPEKAEKGIDISWISTDMEQNSGLLTLAGKCDLRIRLDLWRNGTKSVSHDYTTVASDYSITDQSLLLAKIMKKATQDITAQAIPNIINDISGSVK